MPKLLANMRNRFLACAEEVLEKEGYAALSMRRLADQCGVATGTAYNYFRNKDELIAHIMMDKWLAALSEMERAARESDTFSAGVCGFYRAIRAFSQKYASVWSQYMQSGGSGGVVAGHHLLLRGQIAEKLSLLLARTADEGAREAAPLLAEMALSAAMQPDIPEEMLANLATRIARKPL